MELATMENIKIDALVRKDTIIQRDEGNRFQEEDMLPAESNFINRATSSKEKPPSG